MKALRAVVDVLSAVNTVVLRIGREIAWVAMAVMVVVILIQVFYRYALNAALPWPEEAARALMIWMMALVAPSAYRWGGFVSIGTLRDALPDTARRVLTVIMLIVATAILVVLLQQAIKHYNSGFIFRSSTLKIPLAYIYLAMSVCFALLMSVNTELLLRMLGQLFGNPEDFPDPVPPSVITAE